MQTCVLLSSLPPFEPQFLIWLFFKIDMCLVAQTESVSCCLTWIFWDHTHTCTRTRTRSVNAGYWIICWPGGHHPWKNCCHHHISPPPPSTQQYKVFRTLIYRVYCQWERFCLWLAQVFNHRLLLSISSCSFLCRVKRWGGISGILICSQLCKLTLSQYVHTLTCRDTRWDCDTPVCCCSCCLCFVDFWVTLFVVGFCFCAPAWKESLAVKQGYGLLPNAFIGFDFMKCRVMPPPHSDCHRPMNRPFILLFDPFSQTFKKNKTKWCPCLTLFQIFCLFCRLRCVTSSFATNYGVVAGAASPLTHAVIRSYMSLLVLQASSRKVGIFSLKAMQEFWKGSSYYPCSGSSVSSFMNQNSKTGAKIWMD